MDDEDGHDRRGDYLPRGVLKRKRGWAGEEMELEHQRQNQSTSDPVAVDLGQFQNNEVGRGYQAKHVIRQKTTSANDERLTIRDMSGTRPTEHNQSKRKHQGPDEKLEDYMKCTGMREFRRQLEALVKLP